MLRWTCTPMPWSSLSAAPTAMWGLWGLWGLANLCVGIAMSVTVRLSDCQGALPRNPLRGLAKWIQNGYWHLDMVWYGSDGPDMPMLSRYIHDISLISLDMPWWGSISPGPKSGRDWTFGGKRLPPGPRVTFSKTFSDAFLSATHRML